MGSDKTPRAGEACRARVAGAGTGRANGPGFWSELRDILDGAGSLVEAGERERKEKAAGAVDRLAGSISARGFEAVGIFLAEGAKPLWRLVSQGLHFFTPHLGLAFGDRRVSNLSCLLEDPANLERLATRLEELEERRGEAEE